MSKGTDKPVILVDGSSYLFRAYHALPPLTNQEGQPTGAIYGVINMLRRLMQDYEPTHMAVIFDAKGKTFRNDLFKDYKAHRPPMPEELSSQIAPLHALIKAMGIPLICISGVEADDVIGTLAEEAKEAKCEVVISTGDKDMAQLVNGHVTLINTMSGEALDTDGVVQKFGIPPERIVDYLALIGDKVDNVPGVPKVGPKTALKWLTEYGSLEAVMSHAADIKGKVGENLRAALDKLPLSKTLVTIKRDVPLEVPLTALKLETKDTPTLINWYKRLEFKNWLSEVVAEDEVATGKAEQLKKHYQTLLTKAAFEDWKARLSQAELVAFDTETTSLDYMRAELVGLSFAVKAHEAAYVPLAHDYEGAPKQLERDWVLAQLKPLLEDASIKKIGQNLKYDMGVLARYGIELKGIEHDTLLESYIYNSTATRHDFDSLSLKYLGHTTIHYEDIAGKGAKQRTFNQVDIEIASPYAAEDADVCLQLHDKLWPALQKDKPLRQVYQTLEMPLISVLSRIERNGVFVDVDLLQKQSKTLAKRLASLEQKTYELAGTTFNLGSPKQLQQVLFEELGLPVIKKTPKGQPSTAEDVLQELAHEYELPELILEHRSLSKLKSTYTDKLPLQVNPETGRIHTSYNQAGTATGRLSSSDPNLQNIPIRTEEGRRIRAAFVAPKGTVIVAADYSQIELRIMAHLSDDTGLKEAFAQGEDIHRATAAEVFGVKREEVTDLMRRNAKAINFGLIYGMSAFGLARQLGIDRYEAQDYIDVYFDRYPGVHEYMESTRKKAHQKGFVETLYGRRLYLPEITSSNKMRQMGAERAAINAPMQGTAADIIKRAMIDIDEWLQAERINAKMIMQVHDELVFEVDASDPKPIMQAINQRMMQAGDLSVPLEVGIAMGASWDEAH